MSIYTLYLVTSKKEYLHFRLEHVCVCFLSKYFTRTSLHFSVYYQVSLRRVSPFHTKDLSIDNNGSYGRSWLAYTYTWSYMSGLAVKYINCKVVWVNDQVWPVNFLRKICQFQTTFNHGKINEFDIKLWQQNRFCT